MWGVCSGGELGQCNKSIGGPLRSIVSDVDSSPLHLLSTYMHYPSILPLSHGFAAKGMEVIPMDCHRSGSSYVDQMLSMCSGRKALMLDDVTTQFVSLAAPMSAVLEHQGAYTSTHHCPYSFIHPTLPASSIPHSIRLSTHLFESTYSDMLY